MKKLTDFERALLGALAENARRSITELALRLNTSRPRVRRSLEDLEASGVIRRYTIELRDDSTLEPKALHAFFFVKTKVTRCHVLIEKLKSWPEVVRFWTCSSREVDIQIEVAVASDEELERLRCSFARDPSVDDIYTMAILAEWNR